MKQNNHEELCDNISRIVLSSYFIHEIGASILADSTNHSLQKCGARQWEVKRIDRCDLLCDLFLRNCIFSVDGNRLCHSPSVGGIANSFLKTACVSPTCMEIYVNNSSIANLFTKFSMCISQLLLPFCIGMVAIESNCARTAPVISGGRNCDPDKMEF